MAVLKQITIAVGTTMTKDYNSRRMDCGVTVDIEEGDDEEAVVREYYKWCKDKVREALGVTSKENAAVPKIASELRYGAAGEQNASRTRMSTSDQAVARGHWREPKRP